MAEHIQPQTDTSSATREAIKIALLEQALMHLRDAVQEQKARLDKQDVTSEAALKGLEAQIQALRVSLDALAFERRTERAFLTGIGWWPKLLWAAGGGALTAWLLRQFGG